MATDPHLGTRIKRARERKRWSQRQLAEALEVDRKTIDNWENGRTSPRSSIGAIEDVLGISLAEDEPNRLGIHPEDDHEQFILTHDGLTDDDKRLMIRSYRKAKTEFGPPPPDPAGAEDRSPGRRAASLATAGQPRAQPRKSGQPAAQRASPAA